MLALGTILILLTIIYIIVKTISDEKDQLIALAISTLVLVILVIIIGKYRKKKKEKIFL